MKIDFPCPASPAEFTPTANGDYCFYCAKEVINIDGMCASEVLKLKESDENLCVSSSDPSKINSGFSTRKFALSLLVVFGTSLFSFADAQTAEKINSIKVTQPLDASIGLMQIVFTNQEGDTLSTSVEVQVELPNGKMLKPTLSEIDDTYWVEIPAYAKSKQIVIHADRYGKKKSRTVYVDGLGEAIVEEVQFKVKKVKYPKHRYIGCPSF